jgi:hypothetical protein
VKVFRKEKWVTFVEHVEAHRIAAFCLTFGHARGVQVACATPCGSARAAATR